MRGFRDPITWITRAPECNINMMCSEPPLALTVLRTDGPSGSLDPNHVCALIIRPSHSCSWECYRNIVPAIYVPCIFYAIGMARHAAT